MDSRAILRAWRGLVPADVFISAGPILKDAPPLTEHERASAGTVAEERLRELESGRVYAKGALAMIGITGVELSIAADRSPMWPTGVVGSLTHASGPDGGHFAAAVARTNAVSAVGIDVEREGGLRPNMWTYVMTARELKRILSLPMPARAAEAQAVWCAKEAIGKALLRPLEPTEVEVELDPNGDGFTVNCWTVIGATGHPEQVWHGKTVRSQGFILAAVVLPQRP